MKVETGDRIHFRSNTRWPFLAHWRTVNGLTPDGAPMVTFYGMPAFVVRLDEIYTVCKRG